MKEDGKDIIIETAEEAYEYFTNRNCNSGSNPLKQQKICDRNSETKNNEKLEDQYDIGSVIGKGGYGTIYTGVRKYDDKKVILKHVSKTRAILTRDKNVPLEVSILETLKLHDNIPEILDYFEKTDSFVIVMNDHGRKCMDLFDYISEYGHLNEQKAKDVIKKLLNIIMEIHEAGICHRDIKDENILIDSKGNITLIDFGSGTFLSEIDETPFEGTQLYSPPEWVKYGQYLYQEACVWSLGILLYDLLHGDIPAQTQLEIQNWEDEQLEIREDLSIECDKFLRSCLRRNPEKRALLVDLFDHSWINKTCYNCDSNDSHHLYHQNSYESYH